MTLRPWPRVSESQSSCGDVADVTSPCVKAIWKSPLVARRSPHPREGVSASRAASCLAAGFAHPVALAVGGDDVVVVQQPVEQADGGAVVG
jgi:hypothetical protein